MRRQVPVSGKLSVDYPAGSVVDQVHAQQAVQQAQLDAYHAGLRSSAVQDAAVMLGGYALGEALKRRWRSRRAARQLAHVKPLADFSAARMARDVSGVAADRGPLAGLSVTSVIPDEASWRREGPLARVDALVTLSDGTSFPAVLRTDGTRSNWEEIQPS